MPSIPARIIGAGLGAFFLPACLGLQQQLLPDGRAMPMSAVPGHPAPTVMRRVAPEPAAQQVQYVAVPVTLVAPPSQPAPAVAMVAAPESAPAPVMTASATSEPINAAPVNPTDPVEVVAVTHSAEPPLAAPLAPAPIIAKTPAAIPVPVKPPIAPPAPLPSTVTAAPVAPAVVIAPRPSPYGTTSVTPTVTGETPAAKPAVKPANADPIPPGAQILLLNQPSTNGIRPANHSSADLIPNLIAPPMPPEELKLVSVPKPAAPSACGGPLQTALRAYLDKSPQEASKHLAHLDPANQEVLQQVLPVAAKLGETGLPSADPAEVAELADRLQDVVMKLRSKAALRVDKLIYCRLPAAPVRAGVYQPLPDDHAYHAGETVELYMEVRNFSCEAKDREFLTHLNTAIEIRDDRGEVVNRYEFERDKPVAGQAPRQDHFHICRFPIQGLMPGQYTLTAQITDMPTGKSAAKSLPLRIDPPRRAARGTAE